MYPWDRSSSVHDQDGVQKSYNPSGKPEQFAGMCIDDKIASLQARLRVSIEKADTFSKQKEKEFDERFLQKLAELDAWPVACDFDGRLVQIEHELLEMSNVSGDEYAQLERSLDSLRDNTSSMNSRLQEAAHLQAWLASPDAKTGAELDQRILGVLRAAIEPLAITVAEKLTSFEARINSVTVATNVPTKMATAVEGEEELAYATVPRDSKNVLPT